MEKTLITENKVNITNRKKQAICIQCHNNPEQLNFLIESFPKDKFDIFVHVDLKSDMIHQIEKNKNVFFSKRIDVRWGTFSQVEATLELFKIIDFTKYSYIHLISGACFIAKPVDELFEFFSQSDKEWIESVKLPEESTWSHGGVDRYQIYYPIWLIDRPTVFFKRMLRVGYRKFIFLTKCFKRKYYPVEKFYGSSSWFSLTSECVSWMMKYLEDNKEYIAFFENSLCSDEIFFSTLINLSPYSANIAMKNLRYMQWTDLKTGGPANLKEEDFNNIIKSECMFARKFSDLNMICRLSRKLDEIANL